MTAKTNAIVFGGRLYEWWKDKELLTEFDNRSKALESGVDKGCTLVELYASIRKLRQDKYGR